MSLSVRILDKSPRYFWPWLTARTFARDLIASLDRKKFEGLKKFRNAEGYAHYRKYFDAPYWLRRNIQRALFLRLNKTRKPLRILDLGAGFGYFGYVARSFGHRVTVMDKPGDLLFDEACKLLSGECRHHKITAWEPLPDFGGAFDLITAFQICFDEHYSDTPWGAPQWDFFLSDLYGNHLRSEGRIYLEFNYHPKLGDWLSKDLRSLLKDKYAARFDGRSRVTISKPPSSDDARA